MDLERAKAIWELNAPHVRSEHPDRFLRVFNWLDTDLTDPTLEYTGPDILDFEVRREIATYTVPPVFRFVVTLKECPEFRAELP